MGSRSRGQMDQAETRNDSPVPPCVWECKLKQLASCKKAGGRGRSEELELMESWRVFDGKTMAQLRKPKVISKCPSKAKSLQFKSIRGLSMKYQNKVHTAKLRHLILYVYLCHQINHPLNDIPIYNPPFCFTAPGRDCAAVLVP